MKALELAILMHDAHLHACIKGTSDLEFGFLSMEWGKTHMGYQARLITIAEDMLHHVDVSLIEDHIKEDLNVVLNSAGIVAVKCLQSMVDDANCDNSTRVMAARCLAKYCKLSTLQGDSSFLSC